MTVPSHQGTMPLALPISVKAATQRSTSSVLCTAESWTLILASPNRGRRQQCYWMTTPTNATPTFRNNRKTESYDIDSFVEHFISKFRGQSSITQHHRHDGMLVTLIKKGVWLNNIHYDAIIIPLM